MREEEFQAGEEILERTIYPDGRVVERVVRRVASGAARISASAAHQLPQADNRPPPPSPNYFETYVWTTRMGESDVFAGRILRVLSGGIGADYPWIVEDSSAIWTAFATTAPVVTLIGTGKRLPVYVDVIGPRSNSDVAVTIRVRAGFKQYVDSQEQPAVQDVFAAVKRVLSAAGYSIR